MAFEISEVQDILRILVLINVKKGCICDQQTMRKHIERFLGCHTCIRPEDFDRTLEDLSKEGLIERRGDKISLTEKGILLSEEFKNLLFKDEPVLEVVAGLTDGSITSLIITLSSFLASLTSSVTILAAALTLSAVSLTNFSSFILGGKTEDLADLISLKNLMMYGLNGISDGKERDRSLTLLQELFKVLKREISRSNLYSAALCGFTTFISGVIPIALFLFIPQPLGLITSLTFVGIVVGVFLARYRSKKMGIKWRITFLETFALIAISVIISLIIGDTA